MYNIFLTDFSPRIKDGAFHFPVFHHRKHPYIDAASVSDAGTVIGNDDIHKGKFFTAISLGTPAVFNLVSTLSWVQCAECQISCHEQAPEAGPKFNHLNSTTYTQQIGCSNEDCIDLHVANGVPSGCIEETDTCLYLVQYGGSSQYSVGN